MIWRFLLQLPPESPFLLLDRFRLLLSHQLGELEVLLEQSDILRQPFDQDNPRLLDHIQLIHTFDLPNMPISELPRHTDHLDSHALQLVDKLVEHFVKLLGAVRIHKNVDQIDPLCVLFVLVQHVNLLQLR